MVAIEETTLIRAPKSRCFDLARSVEVHLAGNVHWGESAVAEKGVTTGLLDLGDRVTWRAKHCGVWHRLTSEITEMRRRDYFKTECARGNSARWSTIATPVPSLPMKPKCRTFSGSPLQFQSSDASSKLRSLANTCEDFSTSEIKPSGKSRNPAIGLATS